MKTYTTSIARFGIRVACLFCLLVSITSANALFAQNTDELTEQIIADIYEQIAQDAEEEIDYTAFYDDLMAVAQNPINLNFTTREELSQIRFLSDIQIENLLYYTYRHGKFNTIYELQLIDGLSPYEVRNLLPFVYVGESDTKAQSFRWRNVFRYGKNEVQLRVDRALESKEGYQFKPEEEEEQAPESNAPDYMGDPFYTSLKYRFRYSNKVYMGLTAEKDAGEAFAWNNKTRAYDFYSGYVQFNDLWKFKTIVVGDYQANFGQGLVLQSSFGFGKSSYVLNVAKTENGFKKSGSTNEYSFFRGTAATARLGKFNVSAFYSNKFIDGVPENGAFSSIYKTGLHRTENELAKKRNIRQQVMGGNVNIMHKNLHVGITASNTILSHSLEPEPAVYNVNYFRGTQLLNLGVDYRFRIKKMLFFGETAVNDQQGVATINGFSVSPISQLGLVALHRYYSPKYDSFFANAFAETSRINNEQGFYIGAELRIIRNWKFSLYGDSYSFKYPKFGIDKPSTGFDYLLQADYAPSRTMKMYWRLKWEQKGKNLSVQDQTTSSVGTIDKSSLRYYLTYVFEQFTFKNVFEMNLAKKTNEAFTYGVIMSQDISYVLRSIPMKFDFRFQVFDAQDYENRMYSYEKDVLYAFSIPMYYGLGARYYVNMKYEINEQLALWLKVAQTVYADGREEISSGNEAITGNRKTDVRFMLRYKF